MVSVMQLFLCFNENDLSAMVCIGEMFLKGVSGCVIEKALFGRILNENKLFSALKMK